MTALEASTRIRRASRTASRTIGGRSVVVVIDRQTMHTLNAVGTVVFERADGASLASIIDAVVERFDIDAATAEADVRTFVDQLVELGALEVTP